MRYGKRYGNGQKDDIRVVPMSLKIGKFFLKFFQNRLTTTRGGLDLGAGLHYDHHQ
jgi:hypothetical protein